MALLFADGFEDGLGGPWTVGGSATILTGRFGNGVAIIGTSSMGYGTPLSSGPLIAGVAYYPGSAANGDVISFAWNSNYGIHLVRMASGQISAVTMAGGVTLGTSTASVLPATAWSYVEVKMTHSDTAGIVVVRVNGVQVLNLSAQDTKESVSTGFNEIRLGYSGYSNPSGTAYDDFYLCDGTGSVNNDFLGELTVEHLRPGSDDTAQWLGSDGNSTANYDLVNESGAFASSDYVASSTVGQRDLYLPVASSRPATSPVLGVVVNSTVMKTDAGTRTVKLCVKEGAGGTIRYGADSGLPTSFGELRAVFDRKGDGSQFTVADVNALRFGVEVST